MNKEYAASGVDTKVIGSFKELMLATAQKTIAFPGVYECEVFDDGSWVYRGDQTYRIAKPVLEGLGNKNWIAEWLYQVAKIGRSNYDKVAYCTAMMAVNDMIAGGGMPVTYNDEVAAGDSKWFEDMRRAKDFAFGIYRACRDAHMALVGGESPALKYLVNAKQPVKSAPSLSGCVTGIITPAHRRIDGSRIAADDAIIGVPSTGLHANGFTLVVDKVMELPDKFLTKLPSGVTIGESALQETRCYADLVSLFNNAEIDVHAYQPITGGGVAKIAFNKRPFTYSINRWPEYPELVRYLFEVLGVTVEGCLKTFNCGIGYAVIVPQREAERVCLIAQQAGYDAMQIGVVEEGPRCVKFNPEKGLVLPSPGD